MWNGVQTGQTGGSVPGGAHNSSASTAMGKPPHGITDADFEDLVSTTIRNAENAANKPAEPPTELPTEHPTDNTTEKKPRKEKEKDKATKLVYSDNEVSPEEKMANMPRYAFIPDGNRETVWGDAATAAVTGVVEDAPDVMDTMA